jgi:hypothetical protein
VKAAMSVHLGKKTCCGESYWHLKRPSLLISVDIPHPPSLSQASHLVVAAKLKGFVACVWVCNCNCKTMEDSFPCSQTLILEEKAHLLS